MRIIFIKKILIPLLVALTFVQSSPLIGTKPTPEEIETFFDYLSDTDWPALEKFFEHRDTEFINTPFKLLEPDQDENAEVTFLHILSSMSNKKMFPCALKVCRLLIAGGAKVDVPDSKRQTPLSRAYESKNWQLIKEFLECSTINIQSVIEYFQRKGDMWFINKLLPPIKKDTAHNATTQFFNQLTLINSYQGDNKLLVFKAVQQALTAKNFFSRQKRILYKDPQTGTTPLHLVVLSKNPAAVKALLQAGANPLEKNLKGETPLSLVLALANLPTLAVMINHNPTLLEKEIDPDFKDKKGTTLLIYACKPANLDCNLAALLFKYKAKLSYTNNKKQTIFHLLTCSTEKKAENLTKQFLSNCSDPKIINLQDTNGNTALHLACRHCNFPFIPLLLKESANPILQNKLKETPLHLLLRNVPLVSADENFTKDCVKPLIDNYKNKDDLNLDDQNDVSALGIGLLRQIANPSFSPLPTQYLINEGASPLATHICYHKNTALSIGQLFNLCPPHVTLPVGIQQMTEALDFATPEQKKRWLTTGILMLKSAGYDELLADVLYQCLLLIMKTKIQSYKGNNKDTIGLFSLKMPTKDNGAYQNSLLNYLGNERWTQKGEALKEALESFVINLLNTKFNKKVPWKFNYPAKLENFFKPNKQFNNDEAYYPINSDDALQFYRNLGAQIKTKKEQKMWRKDLTDLTIIF